MKKSKGLSFFVFTFIVFIAVAKKNKSFPAPEKNSPSCQPGAYE